MAVLILFKLAEELKVWAANWKGAEDAEGPLFHRKNECSAMIAVAGQWNSCYNGVVRNMSIHTDTLKGNVLKCFGIANLDKSMLWSEYWIEFR